MFLATSAARDFWDTDDELLLLGPWCVRYEDPDWLKGLKYRKAPNVWDDRAFLERQARYVTDILPSVIQDLADYLNEIHGTRLSARYWHIMIGPWLLHYTQQLLDRYAQIASLLKAYPEVRTILLDARDFVSPRDTDDFRLLFQTDHYNLQLYSYILRFLGKGFPEKRLAPPTLSSMRAVAPAGAKALAKETLKSMARMALRASCRWALRSTKVGLVMDDLELDRGLRWRLILAMRGRAIPLLERLPESLRAPAVMNDRRLGLSGLRGPDEFRRLLVGSLPFSLPSLFLEGFERAREQNIAFKTRPPRAVLATSGLYYNDDFKLAAAEWAERGAQLWGLQHGGTYGTSRCSMGEWHELRVNDVYFTWGWSSSSGHARARDLPALKISQTLARFQKSGTVVSDQILFVLAGTFKNSHYLFSTPMGWQWEEHFAWRERLVRALGDLAPALRVRPFPQDCGWCHKERLLRSFPSLRFDTHSVPFHRRLSEARLVVTENPDTTLLEILALNVPVICFWNSKLWEMRPEAEPFFSGLREAGILHSDPESAAAMARKVYDDPSWWSQARTQSARQAFADRFALARKDWREIWIREFRRELERS